MANKPIFNSFVAKQLLKRGNPIVDLGPDKKNHLAVIFYFEETEKLLKDLEAITTDENYAGNKDRNK